ncbi:hypothetical protein CY35_19G004300 [Sphagnum magellanicum]|nr:hypothetical protein CY35_19G004300 [Sphagnum magellanicum]
MRPNEWHLGWGVKIMWVVVHVVGVGGLLVLDSDLYHLSYYLLLLATVVQYYCTAGSSPGYLADLINQEYDFEANGRLVTDDSCPYCHLWQPLRTKHCHDCHKCVLRSCSTGNWLLQDLFVLIIIIALTATEAFLITLLAFHSYLIMTNQTTYGLTRRKRIPYLKGLPDKAHPFSKGLKANVYSFCSTSRSKYPIYVLPSPEELEARAHSSSCLERQFCSCC